MAEPVDEDAIVGQMVGALTLMTSSMVSAVGAERAWALVDRAYQFVREQAAAEGLIPMKRTKTTVRDLAPDANGIVSVKHNLGSEQVTVKLFNANGVHRRHRKLGVPISPDEVEVIASHLDVSYAEVEIVGESPRP